MCNWKGPAIVIQSIHPNPLILDLDGNAASLSEALTDVKLVEAYSMLAQLDLFSFTSDTTLRGTPFR